MNDEKAGVPRSDLAKSLAHQVPVYPAQVDRIEKLRAAAAFYGGAIEGGTSPSRYQSLAKTALEESLMWAVKAVVMETAQ